MRVTTINDDISLVEMGDKLSNEVVNSITSLDKENDTTRALEVSAKLLNGMSTNNALSLGFVSKEVINLRDGSVVCNNGVTMISGI